MKKSKYSPFKSRNASVASNREDGERKDAGVKEFLNEDDLA